MSNKSFDTMSSISSGQTVLTLVFSYLIVLVYIIPSAYIEALEVSGLELDGISLLKFSRLGMLYQTGHLNEDFRSLFAATELTAGIFEDLILMAIFIAFQFNLRSRLLLHGIAFKPRIRVVVYAAVLDILQTLLSVFFITIHSGNLLLMYLVFILAFLKTIIYIFLVFDGILIWINRLKK